jgi:hypothetical protein
MSQGIHLKTLKQTKARVDHACSGCGAAIRKGDTYYREVLSDAFLQSLHAKKFCASCYTEQNAS